MSPDVVHIDFEEQSARTILDRYELIARLGAGGMATVYLALQRNAIASKLVVVKEILPEYREDEIFRSMFEDEARIALSLAHPNVVSSFEVISEGDAFCLVMEYLEGRSLSQLLRKVGRGRMPLTVHIWVITEVLKGLQYSHELEDLDGTPLLIVHRDVSPANTVITARGEVKVVDFGIAKSVGAITQTSVGTIKGRVAYASPEQLTSEAIDRRSDIYSVGVMLWEALAGERRVKAGDVAAMMHARLSNSEPSLDETRPGLPRELVAITERALALDKEDRFPTAEAMRHELVEYLETTGTTSLQSELSKLLHKHFASELAKTKAAVEQAIANRGKAKSRLTQLELPVEPDSSTPGVADESALQVIGALGTPVKPNVSPNVAALVGGALVLAGVLAWGFRTKPPEPAPPPETPTILASSQTSSAPAPPPPTSSEAAPEQVESKQGEPQQTEPEQADAPRPSPRTVLPSRVREPVPSPAPPSPTDVPPPSNSVKPPPTQTGPGADLRQNKPERRRPLDEDNPFSP